MARSDGKSRHEQAREILEQDLYLFAKYINPQYVYGDIHQQVFKWLEESGTNNHQLLLMPRGHLKSHCIAVWCVWWITKFPATSIVYLSAGEDLATLQIDAIKHMITSDRYRKLWPEMINKEEAKRSRWTAWGFSVDHPQRKLMGTRDMTIIIKTIKSNFTGLHCDVMVYDDVVVPNNAYSEIGRREVKAAVSQCASIKNPGAITKAVGTVYHPADIYSDFKNATVKQFNPETNEFLPDAPLWDVREYQVEDQGDLTGTFLWPRTVNPVDGRSYGFDTVTLAQIQSQYFSLGENAQFYAQYYMQANDPGSEVVSRDAFQFYDSKHIVRKGGEWYFKDKRLALFAAMDVAWTVKKNSDYTAIGVIGVTADWEIFVLALDRFKTQDYNTYFEHVIGLHNQWGFRKLHVETNAGGVLVAKEIKNRLKQHGSTLYVEGKNAVGHEGKKEEKHAAVLIPRIKNGQVFFMQGGLTQVAIEEIVLPRPPHDDLKDVLTACIISATPPPKSQTDTHNQRNKIIYHQRFGGMIRGGR